MSREKFIKRPVLPFKPRGLPLIIRIFMWHLLKVIEMQSYAWIVLIKKNIFRISPCYISLRNPLWSMRVACHQPYRLNAQIFKAAFKFIIYTQRFQKGKIGILWLFGLAFQNVKPCIFEYGNIV